MSKVHNIIKREEKTAHMGQGFKPVLDGCDLQTVRRRCTENKHDFLQWRITAWAREHLNESTV